MNTNTRKSSNRRWIIALRILYGAAALWSAVQVSYLAFALSSSPPSPGAELVNTYRYSTYVAFLGFHCFALAVFALGAALPNLRWHLVWLLPCLGSLVALPIIFLVAESNPRYELYVDLTDETMVRRGSHLLPPGVNEETVAFSEIDLISGKRDGLLGYLLELVTRDGDVIRIGQAGSDRSPTVSKSAMKQLAQVIADKSGASLELR